ncbi:hypothetical protein GCM10010358_73980 [Streptomyces minutiscleroticus]|uniref:Uncharacterized protein n=1 Tax=Streptomyces minutiscleroticus TaxID=68238 RepID=A0A918P0U1_9ACTN|nr:hypothetical protein [Streptomyces minutiscleroticus]GGY10677.1 hypothetical protein GCM10010358_73980 [Streptomyces minutiscleroticus]
MWRISSGHVHGHAYSRLLNIDRVHLQTTGNGQTWTRTKSFLEAIGAQAAACVLLTDHAW